MNSLTTVEAGGLIDSFKADLAPLLAESGQSFDRLKSVFMIAVQQNPDILKCTQDSIRREMGKCAADGLVPDNKEAAMIPYKGILQYQPMVQGIIKRVKELGGVFQIACNLVFEKDEFIVNEADPDSLVHRADRFSKDRGEVVGGYAIFRDDQKRVMHLEIMTLEDFENVRRASKSPDSPAWKNWKQEMYRKAVLRRGGKYIPVNNDKIRALLERQDDLFDGYAGQGRTVERANPFTGEVIDGEVQTQTQSRQDRQQETRQQQNTLPDDRRGGQGADRSSTSSSAGEADGKKQNAAPKKEKPADPPTVPDIDVAPMDKDAMVECAEKVLGIALNKDLDPPGRRGVLKTAASDWKPKIPEYLHDLLRACIEITDWSIKRAAEDQAWSAEHAVFVHKVKTLLDVEKLNIGKYP
jgi:recombination protein RecT